PVTSVRDCSDEPSPQRGATPMTNRLTVRSLTTRASGKIAAISTFALVASACGGGAEAGDPLASGEDIAEEGPASESSTADALSRWSRGAGGAGGGGATASTGGAAAFPGSDEFRNGFDTSRWVALDRGGDLSNNEVQRYTPANILVRDGVL